MARFALLFCMVSLGTGCSSYLEAIPAQRVHPLIRKPLQKELIRVNPQLLHGPVTTSYRLAPGDTLAIAAPELFPGFAENPFPTIIAERQYPRALSATGVPFVIRSDGALSLPLVGQVHVAGLSVESAQARLRQAYSPFLAEGASDDVVASLLLPRTSSILVVREDSVRSTTASSDTAAGMEGTRSRGRVFDLSLEPEDSNILTALVQSGGMPGLDAENQVVVFRGRFHTDDEKTSLLEQHKNGSLDLLKDAGVVQRIPTRIPEGERVPKFDPQLRPGDVVLVEARNRQSFYTGGAFLTGEFPLPRDKPIDILQAVAIAGGTQTGLDYGAGGQARVAGLGDATGLVPPTWIILVRKHGEQTVTIKIDLLRATEDSSQRVVVQPGDYLHLAYKPQEWIANASLRNLGARVSALFFKSL